MTEEKPHVCKSGAHHLLLPADNTESDLHLADVRLHDRLTELRALRDGRLDGHGKDPAANVFDFAGRLVMTLPRGLDPILVTPTEAGGFQLELSDQHGGHEIEIMPRPPPVPAHSRTRRDLLVPRLAGRLATALTQYAHQHGVHHYLSTSCLRGEHRYCQGKTGKARAKRPAECKFCQSHCQCGCHHS
ncbi:hypothetical protein [Streptomyces griseus]|uniref:hypothetical protein n=1 Tax=Streptomyces griseus TaxID=1911 RepID=UPI0036A9C84B